MQTTHKLNEQNRCRLCNSISIVDCLTLPHSPRNISKLLRANELTGFADEPIDLHVYICNHCGFVQLSRFLENTYYDDYLMTTSHSFQMRNYQMKQAAYFIEHYKLKSKQVIEIGCGDGNYLEYLQQAGALVTGNEPSTRFRELAQKKGFKILSDYVKCNTILEGAPYDGFVARQVLEHVPDPLDFIRTIRESLTIDGVGLIEVPSLEQSIEHARFYDFFADHLNYFSAKTLSFALQHGGFEIINIERGLNGEYNQAFVRVNPHNELNGMQQAVNILSSDTLNYIESRARAGQRVAIWGSGAKGLTIMAVAKVKGIAYVIDSDPYKQGLFTPVTHYPIKNPLHLLQDPVDVVIITAMAYRDEIINQLRDELQFKGTIVTLGRTLTIINE